MADNREGGSAMEELPDEILFQLLSLLPPEDVAACGGTCTRLRAVAEDAHLWRSLCAQRFPIVYAAVRFLYLSEHIDGYCMVGSSVHTRVFLGVWYRHRHTAETDVPDRDLSVGWKDYYVKKVVADRIFRAGEFECVELESDTDRRQVCLVAGSRVGRRRGAETNPAISNPSKREWGGGRCFGTRLSGFSCSLWRGWQGSKEDMEGDEGGSRLAAC